jgi:hypothetical protein
LGGLIALFGTLFGYVFKQNGDLAKEYADYRKQVDAERAARELAMLRREEALEAKIARMEERKAVGGQERRQR